LSASGYSTAAAAVA